MIGEKCRDMNVDLYLCFIDYEKAFDRVQHEKLINILKNKGLDGRDINIIGNLYWRQRAVVRIEGEYTNDTEICRGVRQGCILSPILFNIYSESIFEEALNERTEGIVINGQVINNIRYADDSVLLATNLFDLQKLLNKVYETSKSYGLNINKSKTRYMIVSKKPILNTNLKIETESISRVSKYKYLGCWLNDQWNCSQEILCRI